MNAGQMAQRHPGSLGGIFFDLADPSANTVIYDD